MSRPVLVFDGDCAIWRIAGRILLLPGISWMAAHTYRLIATNRHRLPGGTPACQRR
jgi:predicted DCC family thiol-disulfide oxidoreductase YuxK